MKNRKGKASHKKSAAIRNKTVLMVASGILLIALLVAGAVAWYTRVSTVEQLAMKAAEFDFRANYQGENFDLYATDYLTLDGDVAAPGTIGVIPLKVSAGNSETDVNYNLNININTMAPEMMRHIRFFYYPNNTDTPKPISFEGGDSDVQINGTLIAKTAEQYEYIYWEWIWDLSEEFYFDTVSKKWIKGIQGADSKWTKQGGGTFTANEKTEFDKVDTNIGLGNYNDRFPLGNNQYINKKTKKDPVSGVEVTTLAYQVAMAANIEIIGGQARPVHLDEMTAEQKAAATARKSTAGSQYKDMAYVLANSRP